MNRFIFNYRNGSREMLESDIPGTQKIYRPKHKIMPQKCSEVRIPGVEVIDEEFKVITFKLQLKIFKSYYYEEE